jgi:hypothetical protein
MNAFASLLLAASVSGEAALRHAARLSALGPHPWGSPRVSLAARYVEAQFKQAGLQEVRLQPFESHGIAGENVVGELRGRGDEFLVLASHHDTAPDAPGAYDAGGGVGILIETARLLARDAERPRTLVFASFDGEEAWSTGKTTLAGSRAYVRSLGTEARRLHAALVVEMCGWSGGTPTLHALAYADPLRPDRSVIAPRWLVGAASRGARSGGARLALGDPLIPWLYQPAVRVFRTDLYGDDRAFLQAGLPALFFSDSSFTRFYPHYHRAQDTADKLDALALERMGRAVAGAVRALERAERGAAEPHWFWAFGVELGAVWLLALAAASVIPGLRMALRAGGRARSARLLHLLLFGFLAVRQPLPALFVLLAPNLLPLVPRRPFLLLLALAPALGLAGLGLAAYLRGFVHGTFLTPWEGLAAAGALGLALLTVAGPASRPGKGRRRAAR